MRSLTPVETIQILASLLKEDYACINCSTSNKQTEVNFDETAYSHVIDCSACGAKFIHVYSPRSDVDYFPICIWRTVRLREPIRNTLEDKDDSTQKTEPENS